MQNITNGCLLHSAVRLKDKHCAAVGWHVALWMRVCGLCTFRNISYKFKILQGLVLYPLTNPSYNKVILDKWQNLCSLSLKIATYWHKQTKYKRYNSLVAWKCVKEPHGHRLRRGEDVFVPPEEHASPAAIHGSLVFSQSCLSPVSFREKCRQPTSQRRYESLLSGICRWIDHTAACLPPRFLRCYCKETTTFESGVGWRNISLRFESLEYAVLVLVNR